MSFWNTKEGKIIGHGIHDCNSAISITKSYLRLLHQRYKERGKPIDDEFWEYLDKAIESQKKIHEAIDYIYVKFKEDYENKLKV